MNTISVQLKELSSYQGRTQVPQDFDVFWQARWEQAQTMVARALSADQLHKEDVGIQTPAATYARLSFPALDGTTLHARYVCPKESLLVGALVPTAVMFHDCTCGPRGWHHLTRFAALGMAVLELENRAWAGDICAGWQQGPAALSFARLIEDALVTVAVAQALPRTNKDCLVSWGEGLGGALALDAAAVSRAWAKVAALNPMPSDVQAVWENSACELVFSGLRHHFRVEDATAAHARELFDTLAYIDASSFAHALLAPALIGTSLMDTAATPASQFALVNRLPGEVKHLTYPKWAHERVNDFEDAFLAFLHW